MNVSAEHWRGYGCIAAASTKMKERSKHLRVFLHENFEFPPGQIVVWFVIGPSYVLVILRIPLPVVASFLFFDAVDVYLFFLFLLFTQSKFAFVFLNIMSGTVYGCVYS